MRILFVSQPRDPIAAGPAQRGSVAIVLWALATWLARRHEVVVLAPRRPGEPVEETAPEGIRVVRVPPPLATLHRLIEGASGLVPGVRPHMARRLYFAGFPARLVGPLATARPDLVHVMTFAQYLPTLARAVPGVPFVLHLHDELLLRLDRRLASARLAPAAAIVTVSAWLADRLSRHVPEHAAKIVPVGNGVDLERFAPAAVDRRGQSTERLLFVGRISPEKGVHVLLDAFARLAPRRPHLRLELVGEPGLLPGAYLQLLERTPALEAALAFYGRGPLDRLRRALAGGRGYLDAIFGRLPPETRPRVTIVGALPHAALVERYRAADLLVAPSVCNEPFCLPVAEAMASGLPCVTSRCGAPPELVGASGPDGFGEAGVAVPPGDAAALAEALERLLDDPARRRAMARAARSRAERLLGWEAAADRLERVYRGLSAGRAPAG
ncbi:MAG: glycosyltransferase family 4 protein [Geminicoccaceae bacterium]|nr:glycosyltransferase family 4 protein [Geminicoccaceae bacterium]MDW8369679.1 glycosyltransferase family 4 protein [Geminicoccaceae bacterium]